MHISIVNFSQFSLLFSFRLFFSSVFLLFCFCSGVHSIVEPWKFSLSKSQLLILWETQAIWSHLYLWNVVKMYFLTRLWCVCVSEITTTILFLRVLIKTVVNASKRTTVRHFAPSALSPLLITITIPALGSFRLLPVLALLPRKW